MNQAPKGRPIGLRDRALQLGRAPVVGFRAESVLKIPSRASSDADRCTPSPAAIGWVDLGHSLCALRVAVGDDGS